MHNVYQLFKLVRFINIILYLLNRVDCYKKQMELKSTYADLCSTKIYYTYLNKSFYSST